MFPTIYNESHKKPPTSFLTRLHDLSITDLGKVFADAMQADIKSDLFDGLNILFDTHITIALFLNILQISDTVKPTMNGHFRGIEKVSVH